MKKLYALLLVLFMVCSLSLSACDISITNKAEKSGSDAPAISGQSATDEGENSAVTSTSTSDEQSTSGQSGPGGGNAAGIDGDDIFGVHPEQHVYVDGVCIYCGEPQNVDEQGFTYLWTVTGYAVTKAPADAQTVAIPSTYNELPVTSIYNHAFEGHAMSAVVIPDSVRTIGTYAFSGCENLTSVKV